MSVNFGKASNYQASVRVKDEEGPEDEGEEKVDGVDVGGGVAHVDQQPLQRLEMNIPHDDDADSQTKGWLAMHCNSKTNFHFSW